MKKAHTTTDDALESLIADLRVRYTSARSGWREGLARMAERTADGVRDCTLTMRDLQRRYCTLAVARFGNCHAAAVRLGIGASTMKRHLDQRLLAQIKDRDQAAQQEAPQAPTMGQELMPGDWIDAYSAARLLRRSTGQMVRVCRTVLSKYGLAILARTPASGRVPAGPVRWWIQRSFDPRLQGR